MKQSDFDYNLPKELIAQHPALKRCNSRMMVLDRRSGSIEHRRFTHIPEYFKRGDTVVLNNSRVTPARVVCRRPTGGKAEIFLLKRVGGGLYEALLRPSSKLLPGRKLICDEGRITAEIVEKGDVGRLVRFTGRVNIEKRLKEIGRIPLPPYIKRDPGPEDRKRYQTVYAAKDGSTAAPTAGLHFTKDALSRIRKKRVNLSYITLHIGYGTFAPVKVDDIEDHRMHKEDYELSARTQKRVARTKEEGCRVIAVGTSATRTLEDNADTLLRPAGRRSDIRDSSGLFIYPGYKFKIVDALLTNFHLPRSTLLMLVSAFAQKKFILEAYAEAIRKKYRFYSYGDCMLIL